MRMAHATHDEQLGIPVTVSATPSAIDEILSTKSETDVSGAVGIEEIRADVDDFSVALGRSY